MCAKPKPEIVIQRYVDYLNRLFNTTISESRLSSLEVSSPYRMIVRFHGDRRLPLELHPGGWLHFRQVVQAIGEHTEIAEAKYVISSSAEPDDEKAWLVRYDYERDPPPQRPQSHLHINARFGSDSLARLHFPTERVSVEHIIAFLILDLRVESFHDDPISFLRESYLGWLERRTHLGTGAFP